MRVRKGHLIFIQIAELKVFCTRQAGRLLIHISEWAHNELNITAPGDIVTALLRPCLLTLINPTLHATSPHGFTWLSECHFAVWPVICISADEPRPWRQLVNLLTSGHTGRRVVTSSLSLTCAVSKWSRPQIPLNITPRLHAFPHEASMAQRHTRAGLELSSFPSGPPTDRPTSTCWI